MPKKATLTRTIEIVQYTEGGIVPYITLNVLLTDKFHLETVAKAIKEAIASDEDFVLLDKSYMLLGGTSYTREFCNSNSRKVKDISKAQYDEYKIGRAGRGKSGAQEALDIVSALKREIKTQPELPQTTETLSY